MIFRRWVQCPITYEFIYEPTNERFVSAVGYIYALSSQSIYELVRQNEKLVTK